MKQILKIICVLSFFLVSCNKEKRFSKRLMKKEKWEVVEITIDGTKSEFFGIWSITPNVDIYDSVPSAIWNWNNQDALANWQFQDKGKTFVLQYQQQCDVVELDSLDYFTYNISGKYYLEKHGFNKMIFKSNSTNLYSGKEVIINLMKK
jgi:hypothetical protein